VSPPLSFGSLFKRKEKKSPQQNQPSKPDLSRSIGTGSEIAGTEAYSVKNNIENTLTISNALDLLKRMEDEKAGDLYRILIPIRQSLENTLLSMGRIAEEMENEKVKVEDEKFRPSVESSRKILVSSLKKEASSDFPVPTSIPEAKKFQERLQSLMERLGDVSGSHSKLLTTFMKKHTGKIKGEFDVISSLERRTDKIMEDFEDDKRPLMNCITLLTKISQMVDSILQQKNELQRVEGEISRLEVEDKDLAKELSGLEKSSDFETTAKTIKEMKLAQEEENEFRKHLGDLFSPVSRALTKYSYGTSKATSSKLQILMETPWKIFEQAKEQKNHDRVQLTSSQTGDLESYGSLLADVHKAVSTGKIKLKDSEKTIKHFEMIIDSLPTLERRSELISHRLRSLEKKKDHSIISAAEDLRRKLKDNKVALDNNRLYLERLENEIKEKKISIKDTARECEDCLSSVTGRSYVLEIGIDQ
jgi:hypothetical protein